MIRVEIIKNFVERHTLYCQVCKSAVKKKEHITHQHKALRQKSLFTLHQGKENNHRVIIGGIKGGGCTPLWSQVGFRFLLPKNVFCADLHLAACLRLSWAYLSYSSRTTRMNKGVNVSFSSSLIKLIILCRDSIKMGTSRSIKGYYFFLIF